MTEHVFRVGGYAAPLAERDWEKVRGLAKKRLAGSSNPLDKSI